MSAQQPIDIEHFLDFATDVIGKDFHVQTRLNDLRTWEHDWQDLVSMFNSRIDELNHERQHTKEKRSIHQIERKINFIGTQQKRFEVLKVRKPLELSKAALDEYGSEGIWENLAKQYTRLSKAERKLWLFNNCYFLMTTDIFKLVDKFRNIMKSTARGEQRNSLVGGESGNGKTRALNFIASLHPPEILEFRNRAHVVCTEALDDDKSTRSVLRQAILYCGDNYVDSDSVSQLFDKWGTCAQVCQVLLLLVDELNHLHEGVQRRRLLEITNHSNISIIGTAVNPLKFRDGDDEISSRFNDYYKIEAYRGDRLTQLLGLIDLILPLPKRSYLGSLTLKVMQQGEIKEIEGAAPLIERKTKGSLRNIMQLIYDAAEYAIDRDLTSITPTLLESTWNTIQSSDPDETPTE